MAKTKFEIMKNRATYFPIAVDLRGKKAVVVGGGAVGERKARNLLPFGARVLVVSPEATAGVRRLAESGRIEWRRRRFRKSDLAGAAVVFAATSDSEENGRIAAEAKRRGILINVVDDPARCVFIVPATVRRGRLSLAVSTDGACPALARRVRQRLEGDFGPAYGEAVEILEGARQEILRIVASPSRRRDLLEHLVDGVLRDVEAGAPLKTVQRRAVSFLRSMETSRSPAPLGRRGRVEGGPRRRRR